MSYFDKIFQYIKQGHLIVEHPFGPTTAFIVYFSKNINFPWHC